MCSAMPCYFRLARPRPRWRSGVDVIVSEFGVPAQGLKRRSARSFDLRAADYGRLAPAARMHVAERERVVGVELSVPEAVGVGEDKAPVVPAGEFADERSSVFSPPPEIVVTPQNRRPSCPVMSITRSFSSKAGLLSVPR